MPQILHRIFILGLVGSVQYGINPFFVFHIPVHGIRQPTIKRDLWLPPQFPACLGKIHGIPEVVARTVRHEGDERFGLLQHLQDHFHQGQVGDFRCAPKVVYFTRLTMLRALTGFQHNDPSRGSSLVYSSLGHTPECLDRSVRWK